MTTFSNNTSLVEALYVGYFGRAGDPVGMSYWIGQLNAGTITVQNLAASFATQTESKTKYPYLAAPNVANPTEFITQVYQNLFNRAPDAAGLAYWSAQLTAASGNPAAIGNFILNVMSGATGTDNTTLLNKVDVAQDFTTKASNANTSWSSTVQAQSATEISATTNDPATVTAQKAATTTFLATAPGTELQLTPGVDTLSTGATNAAFIANAFVSPQTGAVIQTLNTGDSLTATGTGGSLTAQLIGTAVANLTMQGVGRADVTVTGATAVTGGATGINGLTTINNNGSTAGLTLGAVGNGLKSALSTINVNSPFLAATGNLQTAFIAASALSGASDTLKINLTGPVGQALTLGTPLIVDTIAVGTDGGAGTTGTPQNAYETIELSATGPSFVNLGSAAFGTVSTTTLNISGAGAINVRAVTGTDFAKLANIDASKATGNVTITGATTAGGLLAGTGVNTGTGSAFASFKGGSGNDSIDLSNRTLTQMQALASGSLDGGGGRDTYILSAAAAQTTTALNATGFEIAGVAAATTGTYDLTKLGTGVDTLALSSAATAGATITMAGISSTANTFAAGANGNGANLVTTFSGSGTADPFNFTITDAAGAGSNFGTQTHTGVEALNVTVSQSTTSVADGIFLGFITATPSAGGIVTMTLTDNDGANLVSLGGVGIGAGSLIVTGTGTGGVSLGFAGTSNLDASGLNSSAAATTTGLVIGAFGSGSQAISITGSAGADTLIGGTAADTISGGAGNDTLAGLQSSGTGGDGLADADVLTGGSGQDSFILRGNLTGTGTVAASIAASTSVADMAVTTSASTTDFLTFSTTATNYATAGGIGAGGLQLAAGAQGSITVQSITNAGANPILTAGSEIVKLTTEVVTAGITVQQAFNNAIGTATVTAATANGSYFVTMYDLTNSKALIGIVNDSNGTNTVIESGDVVTLIGSVNMSSADYANLGTNHFSAIVA